MREIEADSAGNYLAEKGWAPPGSAVRELSGGVSNIVLRVDPPGRAPFVIKQCRERLRVPMEWRARLDRIWTEFNCIRLLNSILPDGLVPEILFEDRDNFLFAMTCAPDDAVTWKSRLMLGEIDVGIAGELGEILSTIHARAPAHPDFEPNFSDTTLFEELRVDPYYRTTARAHPDLALRIHGLIDRMNPPTSERTLVLGDFSPKNILVHSGGLILLDFECAHAGDAAFDLGFFSSHLVLKTIRAAGLAPERLGDYEALALAFWRGYLSRSMIEEPARLEFTARSIEHTAACCLARIDGKSPVEYLDSSGQMVARSFARQTLLAEPTTWEEAVEILTTAIQKEI
jgi:5-methylthioribose kinase